MNTRLAITCVTVSSFFAAGVALADRDATSTGSHAEAYVKDSAITTKIKTKLATEHLTSLAQIHVDTDKNGVVWLSGTVGTEAAIRGHFHRASYGRRQSRPQPHKSRQ
jgi:hyperosmotically inducible protein